MMSEVKLPGIAVSPEQQNGKVNGNNVTPVELSESSVQKSDVQKSSGSVQSQKGLEQAAKKINDTLSAFNIKEKVVIDNESGKVVVYLVDTVKHEIIRRIPPDRVLNAANQLEEHIGLFLNEFI